MSSEFCVFHCNLLIVCSCLDYSWRLCLLYYVWEYDCFGDLYILDSLFIYHHVAVRGYKKKPAGLLGMLTLSVL